MKKNSKIMILVIVVLLCMSGCSIIGIGENSSFKTEQLIGSAYPSGTYSMMSSISGFITTGQTDIALSIPLGKRVAEDETINVVRIENAEIRTVNGNYLYEYRADLTSFLDHVQVINDGAVLLVWLHNPEKWFDNTNGAILNNTPVVGTLDISFSIS